MDKTDNNSDVETEAEKARKKKKDQDDSKDAVDLVSPLDEKLKDLDSFYATVHGQR